MAIGYPNGKKYAASHEVLPQQKRKAPVTYGKRGMSLEDDLNDTIAYYLTHEIAVIHKKPTPVQIVSVDYPKEVVPKLRKPTSKHHPQQIIMVCIKENTLILKQKKRKIQLLFR